MRFYDYQPMNLIRKCEMIQIKLIYTFSKSIQYYIKIP